MVERERVEKAGGVQAYQKEVAVNQGFKDLAEQRKLFDKEQKAFQLRQAEAAAAQMLPSPDALETPNLPTSGDYKTKSIAELIKLEHSALIDGDDDVATAAALELHNRRENTSDPAQIVEQTTNAIEARNRAKNIVTSRAKFLDAHPELKRDTRLFEMVDQETNVVMANNPELTEPSDIMERAYLNIKNWKGNSKSSTSMDDKQNEKRENKRPVQASGRVTSTPEPAPQTNSDYIQQLRVSRGLE